MHSFTGVSVSTTFQACPTDVAGAAVTVTGGTNWGTVYDSIPAEWTVVGGSARTVCACGGYIQGGGHSYSSPTYGLAVDNVLQFTAVLANGTIVTASACSNPDLFWALRGGGGGTFAVLTTVTYKLHPTPAAGVVGYSLELYFTSGGLSLEPFLEQVLALTPGWQTPDAAGGVWGGYLYIYGTSYLTFVAVYNSTMSGAQTSMNPLVTFLNDNPAFIVVSNTFFSATSMKNWHDIIDSGDPAGSAEALGCRFVPTASLSTVSSRTNIATQLTALASYGLGLFSHLVVGGAVGAFDRNSSQTSVTPAWRDAAWHLCTAVAWSVSNMTASSLNNKQNTGLSDVTKATDVLRSLFPDSGAYWCESDYNEPNWQQSFWGGNYARLQSVKQAYDPDGVFKCHHCVENP